MVTQIASDSATTMEHHTPLIPNRYGSTSTATIWKAKVLKNAMQAEIRPLFNAVKNADPKMENPFNRKARE